MLLKLLGLGQSSFEGQSELVKQLNYTLFQSIIELHTILLLLRTFSN